MKELKELSASYAAEKTNEMMSQIVAQAFADGYRMGYKDCEEEIPTDLRDHKTEYVDLDLPSGTLWATDYEKAGNENIYSAFKDAITYNIPTREQCLELYKQCRFKDEGNKIYCIGPNGKTILFLPTGYKEIGTETILPNVVCYFWIQNKEEGHTHNTAALGYSRGVWYDTREIFSGYKLPIRIVKAKQIIRTLTSC